MDGSRKGDDSLDFGYRDLVSAESWKKVSAVLGNDCGITAVHDGHNERQQATATLTSQLHTQPPTTVQYTHV